MWTELANYFVSIFLSVAFWRISQMTRSPFLGVFISLLFSRCFLSDVFPVWSYHHCWCFDADISARNLSQLKAIDTIKIERLGTITSQSCLAVRFLRYKIEKGLRAVYFSRPELSPLGSYTSETLSPPPLPLCWCTVSRQDFADSLPGASATVLRLQQSGSALGWTLALIRLRQIWLDLVRFNWIRSN